MSRTLAPMWTARWTQRTASGATCEQHVPVAGSGVDDVRHLVEALDDDRHRRDRRRAHPQVLGEDASVVEGTNVDMEVLTEALAAGRAAATTPAAPMPPRRCPAPHRWSVFARLSRATRRSPPEPVTGMLDRAEPMDLLPQLLGADEEAKYLVAFSTPPSLLTRWGEHRLAVVHVDNGEAVFDDIGPDGAKGASRQLYWKKVPGNLFHQRGKTFIQNATWAPDWSVSGEEILRAWAKVTKEEYDGFIAIDARHRVPGGGHRPDRRGQRRHARPHQPDPDPGRQL